MYRKLRDVTLRSGEEAELGILTGPDEEWGRKVRHLLGHKGEIWCWQIGECLFNAASGIESRFYLLSRQGVPFANVSTFENLGIGTFGHVYTQPEHRRKGAADLLHGCQMEDFKARGGRALYLGTVYGSHAYRLYETHGFQGCEPGSGAMFYFAKGQEAFEAEVFAPGPATPARLEFKHSALLPALAMMKHPAKIRILGMGVNRVVSTEGGALSYLNSMARGETSHDAWIALSNQSRVPVAIACRAPEASFGNHVDLLDVFAAPGHEAQVPGLLGSLALDPARKAVCYVDGSWAAKRDLLAQAGFQRETTLRKHFLDQAGQLHEVEVWSRGGF